MRGLNLLFSIGALFRMALGELVVVSDGESPSTGSEMVIHGSGAGCLQEAAVGDHLLVEYNVSINGVFNEELSRVSPQAYHHFILEPGPAFPVMNAIEGMCVNATRILKWTAEDSASKVAVNSEGEGIGNEAKATGSINFSPFRITDFAASSGQVDLSVRLHYATPTGPDFDVFQALHERNISRIIDIIDSYHGVNSVDENGQSILMLATRNSAMAVVASLLNARKPRIQVNMAKSNGFTALFYSIELPSPSILQALLRRGADPNARLQEQGSKGNTPLHFACMLERR